MTKLNPTKAKIIQKAIELFNSNGVYNVINQDIADAADVSLSNFNYHFPKKKDLMYAVCGYLSYVLDHRIKQNSLLVNDGIILELTKIFLQFENDFKFFYLETQNILRAHPDLREQMENRVKEDIQMIKNLNFIAIGKGYMKPELKDFPGLYDMLANQIWMTSHFWFAQTTLKRIEGNGVYKGTEACFAVLYPYLTPKGKEVYLNFLAENKKTDKQNRVLATK
jgi:AcrR family transcriptional regulator